MMTKCRRRPSGRSRTSTLSQAAVSMLLLVIAPATVLAYHGGVEPDTGFEVEGNLQYDGLPLAFYDCSNSPYPPANLIADPHSKSATDPDIFKPNGKFGDPSAWSIQPGSVGSALSRIF